MCLLRDTDWVFEDILKRSLHLMPDVWLKSVSIRKALKTACWIKVHNALCGPKAPHTECCTACYSHSASLSLLPIRIPEFSPNAVTTQVLSAYSNGALDMTSRHLLHFQKLHLVCNLCLPEGRSGTEWKL